MKRRDTLKFLGGASVLAASIGHAQAPARNGGAAEAAPRVGYLCFRVADLARSLEFYTRVLGMKEQRRIDGGNGVVEVLLGYGEATRDAGLMLMHDPKRTTPYDLGDGFSRFILYVPDLQDTTRKLNAANAKIIRPLTRVESLRISILIARDPDGYAIEFIQRDAA